MYGKSRVNQPGFLFNRNNHQTLSPIGADIFPDLFIRSEGFPQGRALRRG